MPLACALTPRPSHGVPVPACFSHACMQGEEDGSLEGNVMAASLNTTRRMAMEAGSGATLALLLGDLSYAE